MLIECGCFYDAVFRHYGYDDFYIYDVIYGTRDESMESAMIGSGHDTNSDTGDKRTLRK